MRIAERVARVEVGRLKDPSSLATSKRASYPTSIGLHTPSLQKPKTPNVAPSKLPRGMA